MNAKQFLKKYSKTEHNFERIYRHSKIVQAIAIRIAKRFEKKRKIKLNMELIENGSLLHDLGVLVLGDKPYIQHGILGAEVLRKQNLYGANQNLAEKYARVCERHIGVGITKKEIIAKKLPLPKKDFIAQSWEEKIISYADSWHSKSMLDKNGRKKEHLAEILQELGKYGADKVEKFLKWHKLFE